MAILNVPGIVIKEGGSEVIGGECMMQRYAQNMTAFIC